MRQYETYRCETCGNEVEVLYAGEGELACCGEAMGCTTENLTAVNLMKAFAGESMARNKYQYFAEIAREEGLHAVSGHFEEAAENERWHALAQFKTYHRLLDGAEREWTLKNLATAMDGERYEHAVMYPGFAKIAEEEGHKDVARLFRAIGAVEVEHEREYGELSEALKAEGFFDSEVEEAWVCEVCGHVHRGRKAPGACYLCKAPREYFKRENLY